MSQRRPADQAPPRSLVVLLAAVVIARVAIVFVVGSPLVTALAWAGLLAVLGMVALRGQGTAAKALAYLCIVLGVDTLAQLLTNDVSGAHLAAALLWASLVLVVGAYILFSASVRRFYAA